MSSVSTSASNPAVSAAVSVATTQTPETWTEKFNRYARTISVFDCFASNVTINEEDDSWFKQAAKIVAFVVAALPFTALTLIAKAWNWTKERVCCGSNSALSSASSSASASVSGTISSVVVSASSVVVSSVVNASGS